MPTLEAPRDLTIPEPGSSTARQVLSLALRRSLRELQHLAPPVDPVEARDHRAVMQAVAGLARRAPGVLAAIVRRPNVGALLRTLRPGAARGIEPATIACELRATLLAELAAANELDRAVRLERLPAQIIVLGARNCIDVPPDHRGASFESGAIVLGEHRVDLGRTDPAFAPIDRGLVLATVDNNPLSMFEAHPDKEGNAIDLGGRPATTWAETLRDGLKLIERYLPDLRAEIDLFIHQVVPVGFDEHTHLSASYQEAIGTIYMTLHPQRMTMVEATIHEFQHNKLNALFELDPVLHNAFHPLYQSPVRPDPRPLHGIILAVHAFQPVARLYERMLEARDPATEDPFFARRYAQIRAKNHEGATVLLEHARPTPVGQGLLDEIARWDDHFAVPT